MEEQSYLAKLQKSIDILSWCGYVAMLVTGTVYLLISMLLLKPHCSPLL